MAHLFKTTLLLVGLSALVSCNAYRTPPTVAESRDYFADHPDAVLMPAKLLPSYFGNEACGGCIGDQPAGDTSCDRCQTFDISKNPALSAVLKDCRLTCPPGPCDCPEELAKYARHMALFSGDLPINPKRFYRLDYYDVKGRAMVRSNAAQVDKNGDLIFEYTFSDRYPRADQRSKKYQAGGFLVFQVYEDVREAGALTPTLRPVGYFTTPFNDFRDRVRSPDRPGGGY